MMDVDDAPNAWGDDGSQEMEDGNLGMDGYGADDDTKIRDEDCWTIITSYFEEKGLVRQQVWVSC